MYSNSRRTPSSSARAVTFTNSSIRASARSLNSRVHRVRVVPVVQGRVLSLVRDWVFNTLVLLDEQCVLFPCLSSGVHSRGKAARIGEAPDTTLSGGSSYNPGIAIGTGE